MKTSRIAQLGLMTALAMVLSYLEARIPVFFAVPGMKLGLTNIVVVTALYMYGWKEAVIVNFVRILLVAMLFGSGVSFVYSLAGGLLSGAVMILLKSTGWFRMVTVSIAGGICHNAGQIIAAMLLLGTSALGWYMIILWFTGMATGLIIGIISAEVTRRLKSAVNKSEM